jgi:hypothetical protein
MSDSERDIGMIPTPESLLHKNAREFAMPLNVKKLLELNSSSSELRNL